MKKFIKEFTNPNIRTKPDIPLPDENLLTVT